jgi:hypothetical protein
VSNSDLSQLRTRLEQLQRPGLAKTQPQSMRERAEWRSTVAFGAGFNASGMPEAALARRLGVCTRMIRDWRSGARAVPNWAICALPRDGQVAALKSLAGEVPDEEEQQESA